MVEQLGGLTEVIPSLERGDVGVSNQLLVRELRVDPLEDRLHGPGVHPGDEPEREQVLGPLRVTRLHPEVLTRQLGEGGHRHRVHLVFREAVVLEGVGGIADLVEVSGRERVGVRNDRRTGGQIADVGHQGRRVHHHEQVGHVARGEDVEVGDVDLEARHTGDRACRSPDLGRVVGQGGQVVAKGGADVGEAVTDELHPVAGVAGESDHDPLEPMGPVFALLSPVLGCRGLGGVGGHAAVPLSLDRSFAVCRPPA